MKFGGLIMCAVLLLAFGCGGDSSTTLTVSPGESIQAAVDAASPGDTVEVMPGDYTETHQGEAAVRVTKSLKLIAKSSSSEKVRILPGPGQKHGILVEPENSPDPGAGGPADPDIDGIEIKGFTVEGFDNNGIWLRYVKNFTIEDNESIDNLENGIWPTLSAGGLVKNNVSYGSLDTAMWVEGSEDVRVIGNELRDSVIGLEITVSNEITVENNEVFNNTTGIGLFHPAVAPLPPLQPLERNGFSHVINNDVHDNNAENLAPPGTEAEELPPGIGILVMGVDNNDVQNNRVENNEFLGIGVVDYCLVVAGTPVDCTVDPPEVEDVKPELNRVIGNTLVNNHGDPPPGPFQDLASDIVELGGADNCYSDNVIENTPPLLPLTIPSPLPPC